MYKTSSLS